MAALLMMKFIYVIETWSHPLWARSTSPRTSSNPQWHSRLSSKSNTNHYGLPVSHPRLGERIGVSQDTVHKSRKDGYTGDEFGGKGPYHLPTVWKGTWMLTGTPEPFGRHHQNATSWYQPDAGGSKLSQRYQQSTIEQQRSAWHVQVSDKVTIQGTIHQYFLFLFISDDLEVIKEQNASLQIHVLHLHEEINETQGKTRKVRDVSRMDTNQRCQ